MEVEDAPEISSGHPDRLPAVPQDIANYLSRQVADQQLRCVVRLAGRVDAGLLARAARLALDAEPILGCRFVADSHRPFWERRPDLDESSICQVLDRSASDDPLNAFLAGPLDPAQDPLTLVGVVHAAEEDIVAVKLSHVVSDIGGLKDYLTLLTSIYRGLRLNPSYRPEAGRRANRGQEQVLRSIPIDELRAPGNRMGGAQPAWGFPRAGDDVGGAAFASRRLEPDQLTSLREVGRALGATVNDLFLAALFRALAVTLGTVEASTLTIQTTVDLRRYLPDGRAGAICNLSSIVYPAIAVEEARTFDSALAAVAAYLERAFQGDFENVLRSLRWRSGSAATGRAHPMLTNCGVLPEDCVDFGETLASDAVLHGPVVYPPGFAMGLSTFRGALTCSVAYPPGAVDAKVVEGVLDLVVEELPLATQ